MNRPKCGSFAVAVIVCALFVNRADAQLGNPGFETGSFPPWTTTGSAVVIAALGPVNPDSGTSQAQLNNGAGAVPAAAVETFLGLVPGALNGLGNPATQGSAIKQTLVVVAGSTLTIRYNFLTNENTPDTSFNDFAFFSVSGPGATLVRLANTQSAGFGPAAGTPYTSMTGYQTFTFTFTASGTVTVGLGVLDVLDTVMDSGLLVDDGAGAPPGVLVTESGGSTNVTEGGATDSYTLVLTKAPTANVTITATPDAFVTVAPTTLTFTPANWNTPQTITVTAVDDFIAQGTHPGVITHAAVSADPVYNGIAIANVTASVKDNDTGVFHTLTTGVGDGSLTVQVDAFGTFGDLIGPGWPFPRGWGKATYDPIGAIGPAGCVFDSWVAMRIGGAGPRTRLAGPASTVVAGTTATCNSTWVQSQLKYQLTQTVAPRFNGAAQIGSQLTQTYTITNTSAVAKNFELVRFFDGDLKFDGSINDGGGFLPGPPQTFFECDKGGSGATSTTFVGIQAEGGAIPAAGRYQFDLPRLSGFVMNGNALTDTVFKDTAPVDGFVDAGSEYDVHIAVRNTFALAPGASATYTATTIFGDGAPTAAISGVTVTESGGSTDVTEGAGSDNYTVVLVSAPTANVTINVYPGPQLVVVPPTLTFTPANWNVPQTVTVSAIQDFIYEGPHTSLITHTATSADPAYNNIPIAAVLVNITDADLPPPPPPPPGGNGGNEGTFAGCNGPSGGIERTFGLGGGDLAAQPSVLLQAAAAGPPALLGPFLIYPDGTRSGTPLPNPGGPSPSLDLAVYNVAYQQRGGTLQQSSAGLPGSVLALWSLAAAVVSLALAWAAVAVAKRTPSGNEP